MPLEGTFTLVQASKESGAYILVMNDHVSGEASERPEHTQHTSFIELVDRLTETHLYGWMHHVHPEKGGCVSFFQWNLDNEKARSLSKEEHRHLHHYLRMHNDLYRAIGTHPEPRSFAQAMI